MNFPLEAFNDDCKQYAPARSEYVGDSCHIDPHAAVRARRVVTCENCRQPMLLGTGYRTDAGWIHKDDCKDSPEAAAARREMFAGFGWPVG